MSLPIYRCMDSIQRFSPHHVKVDLLLLCKNIRNQDHDSFTRGWHFKRNDTGTLRIPRYQKCKSKIWVTTLSEGTIWFLLSYSVKQWEKSFCTVSFDFCTIHAITSLRKLLFEKDCIYERGINVRNVRLLGKLVQWRVDILKTKIGSTVTTRTSRYKNKGMKSKVNTDSSVMRWHKWRSGVVKTKSNSSRPDNFTLF